MSRSSVKRQVRRDLKPLCVVPPGTKFALTRDRKTVRTSSMEHATRPRCVVGMLNCVFESSCEGDCMLEVSDVS